MTFQEKVEQHQPANSNPVFCTGYGQYDSHAEVLSSGKINTSNNAGTDYQSVSGKEIVALVRNPPSVPKTQAQWMIPSTYMASDGRDFDVQRNKGEFWFLPLDEDGTTDNNLGLDEIDGALRSVCGDVGRMVYSTRSSTAGKRKWRGLVPLAKGLSGPDYEDTVAAFNALLIEASDGVLIPDRAFERAAQLIYLPNRGQHYESNVHKAGRLDLTPEHPIIVKREAMRAERGKAAMQAQKRRKQQRKRAQADPDGAASVIEAFNKNTSVADELERHGYQRSRNGKDWKSPNSSTGSYAVRDFGDFWISQSGSDAAAEIGNLSPSGARVGDAFDLFAHYEHGGEKKAAVKAYAEEIGMDHKSRRKRDRDTRKEVYKERPPEINPAALRLAKRITQQIREICPALKDDPFVDKLIIRDMIEGAFWTGVKSKLFLLDEAECLLQFGLADAWKFLCRRFGSPVDLDKILKQWLADHLETLGAAPEGKELPKGAKEKIRKAIYVATATPILDHLRYENQRDAIEWHVNMFGQRPGLDMSEDVVRITLTHKSLACSGSVDAACISDYKDHFPLLDEMLEYIVASRFALDRKKSYLWMLAASDWGKGFLMGALRDLGLVVEMSVKEIEAMLEGKPSGRSPEDFKRAMILAVDEFKSVKSELKQLQSEIPLAPKYQLTSKVQIYTKLFLSAESVGSLVGENGVEDQFANRMSLLTGSGKLNGRAVYDRNQSKYYRAVRAYVAQELNRLIETYRALGRDGAEQRADKFLNDFIARHGLDQYFERLSESYPAIAEQAIAWVRDNYTQRCIKLEHHGGSVYLTSANKVFDEFLKENFSVSEISTLRRRKTEIMALMSEGGKGPQSHKLKGKVLKALKLKA